MWEGLIDNLGPIAGAISSGVGGLGSLLGAAGKEVPELGMISDVIGVAGGAATAITGDEPGDFMGGMSDVATGMFSLLCDGADSGFGEMAGPAGGGLAGVLGMAQGGVQALSNTDQINQGGLFNDEGGRNEFWGGAGDATLGGMHTLVNASALLGPEMIPIAMGLDTALNVGEGVVDGAGFGAGLLGEGLEALTGTEHDWSFGAGDVVGAAEHAAFSTVTDPLTTVSEGGAGTALAGLGGAALGGGAGLLASGLTGGIAAPLIPLLAAGGGSLASSLADRGIGGTLDAITGWF